MKKVAYLFMLIALVVSCTSEPQYVLSGSVSGLDEGTVVLQKRVSGKMERIDSATIVNGVFEFPKGSVDYPEVYYLGIDGKRGNKMFFLENEHINVTGNADSLYNATVAGGVTNDEYNRYNKMMEPFAQKNTELYQEYRSAVKEGRTEDAEALSEQRQELSTELEKAQMDWIKNNPSSYATPTILRSLMYGMDAEELNNHVNALDPKLKETDIVKLLQERVVALGKVAIGKVAPDFTMNDTGGNPVQLSDIIGPKVLLVDFWASWCGPCRAENPNVVKVYNEFHDKGFDILGVSLDSNKDAWLKGIADDHLDWHHVSDLKYWENAAAKLYAVNAIPANFLLDSKGVIIATNLRGDALRKKVAELLGE